MPTPTPAAIAPAREPFPDLNNAIPNAPPIVPPTATLIIPVANECKANNKDASYRLVALLGSQRTVLESLEALSLVLMISLACLRQQGEKESWEHRPCWRRIGLNTGDCRSDYWFRPVFSLLLTRSMAHLRSASVLYAQCQRHIRPPFRYGTSSLVFMTTKRPASKVPNGWLKDKAQRYQKEALAVAKRTSIIIRQRAEVTAANGIAAMKQLSIQAAERTKGFFVQAGLRIRDRLEQTIHSFFQATRDSINQSVANIQDSAVQTSRHVQRQIRGTIQETGRSLLYWALAAVGVYGVTTTLTREAFQYVTRKEESTGADRWRRLATENHEKSHRGALLVCY